MLVSYKNTSYQQITQVKLQKLDELFRLLLQKLDELSCLLLQKTDELRIYEHTYLPYNP